MMRGVGDVWKFYLVEKTRQYLLLHDLTLQTNYTIYTDNWRIKLVVPECGLAVVFGRFPRVRQECGS